MGLQYWITSSDEESSSGSRSPDNTTSNRPLTGRTARRNRTRAGTVVRGARLHGRLFPNVVQPPRANAVQLPSLPETIAEQRESEMQWLREEDALDRAVRRDREGGGGAMPGGVDSSGTPLNFAEAMRRARSRGGMRPRSPPVRNTAPERPHQLPEDNYYYPSTDSFATHGETSPPRLSGSESPIASLESSDPYAWTTRPDGSVIPPSRMDLSMDLPARLPRITPRSPLPDVLVASEADTEPLSLRGGTTGGAASLSSRIARRRLLLAARAGRPDNAPTFASLRGSLPDGERAARIEAEHGLEPVFANERPDMEAARRNIEAIDRRMSRIRRDAQRIEGLASPAPVPAIQREEQGGERREGNIQGQLEDLMRRAESINERYESLGFPVDGAERRRMRRRVEMLNEQYASFASREDGERREAEPAGQRPVGADPGARVLHIEAPSARFRRIRGERDRRRLNPNMPSGRSGVERGMGMDGNRGLENDSGNMWHTLLTTMSPDPQPPSASSSFDTLLADVIGVPYYRLGDGHRAEARGPPAAAEGEREEMGGDTSMLVDGPGDAETSASTSMNGSGVSANETRSGDTSQTSISPPDASPVGPSPADPVGGLSAHADFENVCETFESQPLDLGVGGDTEVDEDEEDIYELRPAPDPAIDRFWRGYTDVVARRADRVARHSRLRSEHPLGGMQRIVQRLASRDDIPDDWWAGAGLTRILPREA